MSIKNICFDCFLFDFLVIPQREAEHRHQTALPARHRHPDRLRRFTDDQLANPGG